MQSQAQSELPCSSCLARAALDSPERLTPCQCPPSHRRSLMRQTAAGLPAMRSFMLPSAPRPPPPPPPRRAALATLCIKAVCPRHPKADSRLRLVFWEGSRAEPARGGRTGRLRTRGRRRNRSADPRVCTPVCWSRRRRAAGRGPGLRTAGARGASRAARLQPTPAGPAGPASRERQPGTPAPAASGLRASIHCLRPSVSTRLTAAAAADGVLGC